MSPSPISTLHPIERGIPVPPPSNPGRPSLYPFKAMQVGDSFFAPTIRHSIRRNAYNHGVRLGTQYTTRFVTEKGVKGTRVWRIA